MYNATIRNIGGKTKILDNLRRKFVALTPEEWVRQNFVHFLIEHKSYSPALMANEMSVNLNGTTKRCDSVVFDNTGKPCMIIEYKAPSIQITEKVFQQIIRYDMVLQTKWLVVSNGIQHYCCRINKDTNGYTFVKDIPAWSEL